MKSAILAVICLTGVACVLATQCQDERAEAERRENDGEVGVMMPKCDAAGDYEAKQCHASIGMCKCVRTNGSILAEFSRTIEACNCMRHRDVENNKPTLGQFIPSCNETTGFYNKVQCHGSECQCVDQVTGEKFGESVHLTQKSTLKC